MKHTGLTGEILDLIGTTGRTSAEVTELLWRRPEYHGKVNREWLACSVYHRLWTSTKKGWCCRSNDKPARYAKMPT